VLIHAQNDRDVYSILFSYYFGLEMIFFYFGCFKVIHDGDDGVNCFCNVSIFREIKVAASGLETCFQVRSTLSMHLCLLWLVYVTESDESS